VYVPFYLHSAGEKYHAADDAFFEKAAECICTVNKSIARCDIKEMRIFRYEYAQPVPSVNFLEKLPPMYSDGRKGFYFADTAFGYPRERSINESIDIAKRLARAVIEREGREL
jgi:protoporphyrinogen oxidase